MTAIKIRWKVEKSASEDLRALAAEARQNILGRLTDAIRGCIQRRRVPPDVLRHLHDSMNENETLGRRLAE